MTEPGLSRTDELTYVEIRRWRGDQASPDAANVVMWVADAQTCGRINQLRHWLTQAPCGRPRGLRLPADDLNVFQLPSESRLINDDVISEVVHCSPSAQLLFGRPPSGELQNSEMLVEGDDCDETIFAEFYLPMESGDLTPSILLAGREDAEQMADLARQAGGLAEADPGEPAVPVFGAADELIHGDGGAITSALDGYGRSLKLLLPCDAEQAHRWGEVFAAHIAVQSDMVDASPELQQWADRAHAEYKKLLADQVGHSVITSCSDSPSLSEQEPEEGAPGLSL